MILGMPYIDTLNIININMNTIDTRDGSGAKNLLYRKDHFPEHMAQTTICKHDAGNGQNQEMLYNTDSISKLDNTDKPMVKNKLSNTILYFLPGPNYDNDKRPSAEITEQLQRCF